MCIAPNLFFREPNQVRSGGFPADRVQWTWESDISTGYDFSKNVRME